MMRRQSVKAVSEQAHGSGWRELGAGSDAALLIWAPNLEGLFDIGARSVIEFSTQINYSGRSAQTGPTARIESFDRVDLLIDWLNEVNYRLHVHRWVTRDPEFQFLGPSRLFCRMDGMLLDPAQDRLDREIKAVTRHKPYLGRGREGTWVTKITLDL